MLPRRMRFSTSWRTAKAMLPLPATGEAAAHVSRGHHLWALVSGHQVANDAKTISGTTGKSRNQGYLRRIGWGTWIRTRTNGVRVRWSTVNLFPKAAGGVLPPRRCGGLINKRTPDANTFCQKNAAALCRTASRARRTVPSLAMFPPLVSLRRGSKKVWRTGAALVQSPQRKIERAP